VDTAGLTTPTIRNGRAPMARARNSSKRNRGKRAAPALGIAGVSLAMAGGASASTAGSAMDVPVQNTATHHELFLGDEEISDVSLSTFYIFDKENDATLQVGEKVAWGCRCGCRGCRCGGCRCGWRGCWGCGGCGGCCLSWGRCRWC
jgi:hypothetical protein